MDNRLKRVEFQPINLLTDAQVQAAIDSEDELTGRDAVVSLDAPHSFKRVVDGYIYGDKANGNQSGTTVELWVEASTGANTDNTIEVSGVRRAAGKDFEISGKFKLVELDEEPFEDRPSWRATPTGNVIETLYYRSESDAPNSWTTSRQLQTKRQISKYSATTETVTLTMNATHNFKAGDIISVELDDADIRLFGIDGLFRVKEVTANTIVYDFDVPIEEPINEATLSEDRFVYPVVREFIREGATWIQDGSEEDGDVVWVWKDYRWINIREYTGSDGVAPNPPTNLKATSTPNKDPGAETGTATIKLTWDAPTRDVKNKPLRDLAGYAVWWKRFANAEWKKEESTGNDTVWESSTGFEDGQEAFFRVYAKDSGGILSDFAAVSHTPNLPFDPNVKAPSAPEVITYLGATRVSWNGKDFEAAVASRNTFQIELHWSSIDGFTPNADTLYERFPAIPGGAYLVIPNREFGSIDDSLPDDTTQTATVYFKFLAVDIFGKPTASSIQTVANVQLNKIVKFAELDVDSFVGKVITGATYQTNTNVTTTGGIQFTKDFFATYSPGGAETFRINAKTGAVTIGGGLGLSALNTLNASINDPNSGLEWTRALAISANGIAAVANNSAGTAYTLAVTANGLAFTANTRANNAYSLAVTAEGIAISAGSTATTANTRANTAYSLAITAQGLAVTANSSAGTAITRINAGDITITKAKAIGAVNQGESTSTTRINGDVIDTGTLRANRITTGTIGSGVAVTGAGNYRTTSGSGQRITIDGPTNSIQFVSQTSSPAGFITGAFSPANGISMVGPGSSPSSIFLANAFVRMRGPSSADRSVTVTSTRGAEIAGLVALTTYAGAPANLRVGSGGLLSRATSDLRMKKEVKTTDLGLNFINKLNPVSFKWDTKNQSDKKTNYGLIAQEVEEVLNEIGDSSNISIVAKYRNKNGEFTDKVPDEDIIYGLDYEALISPLIKAIQELSAKVEYLESKDVNFEGTN